MHRVIFQISIALIIYDQAKAGTFRLKRQVNHEINSDQDRQEAESGLASAAIASGKYFQDIFSEQSAPHKIEFGHVCETPEDWEQRFERKDFKKNKHQGKVRWGDKHGGYGEHYWDYNHDGHDGHDGEESQNDPQYAKYDEEESQHNPQILVAPNPINENHNQKPNHQYQPYIINRNKRQPDQRNREEFTKNSNIPKNSRSSDESFSDNFSNEGKRQHIENFANFAKSPSRQEFSRGKRHPSFESDDVEFIDNRARSLVESGRAEKHGGNYRRIPGLERGKRDPVKNEETEFSDFVYEPDTGKMVNQRTGDVFELININ